MAYLTGLQMGNARGRLGNLRSHKPGHLEGYSPHFDSLRHRERRSEFNVFRHSVQLGGIVLLQAPRPSKPPHIDAHFYSLPCGEQGEDSAGRPVMHTPAGPLRCDESSAWKSDLVDQSARKRYFYVERGSLQELRQDAAKVGRPIQRAPLSLQQGDMYHRTESHAL
jgi:hypothetical protein